MANILVFLSLSQLVAVCLADGLTRTIYACVIIEDQIPLPAELTAICV